MKAIGYNQANFKSQSPYFTEFDLPIPELGAHDILVKVKAASINPADVKLRQFKQPQGDEVRVLGFDSAGVVVKVGSAVTRFKVEDSVFYSGHLFNGRGSNSEFQVVDSRLVALKPSNLSFEASASLPLVYLTAMEGLLDVLKVETDKPFNLLLIGGAGGVGTAVIQLVQRLTKGKVYATYAREESKSALLSLGVAGVLNRQQNLKTELANYDIEEVDYVFSTHSTETYLDILPSLIKPFGRMVLIDDPEVLDITDFKAKSISVGFEFMNSKVLQASGERMQEQGDYLQKVATLAEQGLIKPLLYKTFVGLTAHNLSEAHALSKTQQSIGKIVIRYE